MMTDRNIPQHVAIIMDGNGRWARSRGLPKVAGHRAGVKSAQAAIESAIEIGVKVLTLYTFSTENWKRPKSEVELLFRLLEDYLTREEERLVKNNIRLSVLGDIEGLPDLIKNKLKHVMEVTKDNTKLILNLALNYGSRHEIINAIREIAKDVESDRVKAEDINEQLFSSYLYTKGLPDPDLLIRTSGEFRVSNFLLWQISYSEIYVTKKLWPDFKKGDFKKAITDYQKRERRFGG